MTRTARPPRLTRLILDDNAPAFVGVKRALLARIGSEWKVGDRLPRVSDLAKSMRVGQNNAQRAVSELVAEGVLFSRRRLGVFVRQLPLPAGGEAAAGAGALHGRSIAIAVFAEPVPPFVGLMVRGLREAVEQAGAQVQMVDGNTMTAATVSDQWATVLLNPTGSYLPPQDVQRCVVVSTADHLHPQLLARHDSVCVDQYQGGGLAGERLRRAGCTRLCFVGRRIDTDLTRYDLTSSARLHGLERGFGEHLDPSHLLYVRGYSVHSGGLRLADYLQMSPRPDGVFCASDELAMGFMAAAASHGLTAGRDFQLVGFDGQDQRALGGGTLTTISVPALTMGRLAGELLIERVQRPQRPAQRVLLPCTLSDGDTCRD
jgi:DNA-binding LacI/PurR family transcriptional regulator